MSSPASSTADPLLVGTLNEWNPDTKTKTGTKPISIYSSQELYIGRDATKCHLVVDNPFVSNRHIKIYTIVFDYDKLDEISPLVYAQNTSRNGTLWNGYPMELGCRSYLLSHGDTLKLPSGICLQFRSATQLDMASFDALQKVEMRAFERQYEITKRKLGSGAYGQVHMAVNRGTGQQLACKIIDLRPIKEKIKVNQRKPVWEEYAKREDSLFYMATHYSEKPRIVAVKRPSEDMDERLQERLAAFDREAEILGALNHPNIIGIERVIKSNSTIYLFQELITAGDLHSYIRYKGGKICDIEAAPIVRQILLALQYLHGQHIIHRDLKPDNILMTSLAEGSRVVLTDFGCAKDLGWQNGRAKSIVGTMDYCAPEIFVPHIRTSAGYGTKVDMWSLGAVTFALLTGRGLTISWPATQRCPMWGNNEMPFHERVGDYLVLTKVGMRARKFVFKALMFDPVRRFDAADALEHDWFTNRSHKKAFEELGQRCIRDWRPRIIEDDGLIVQLDELAEKRKMYTDFDEMAAFDEGEDFAESEENEFDSSDFPDCTDVSDPLDPQDFPGGVVLVGHSQPSFTLSDPDLPPLKRPKDLAGSSCVEDPCPSTKRPTDKSENINDEVYEEVNNAVTGKRQRVAYGLT